MHFKLYSKEKRENCHQLTAGFLAAAPLLVSAYCNCYFNNSYNGPKYSVFSFLLRVDFGKSGSPILINLISLANWLIEVE